MMGGAITCTCQRQQSMVVCKLRLARNKSSWILSSSMMCRPLISDVVYVCLFHRRHFITSNRHDDPSARKPNDSSVLHYYVSSRLMTAALQSVRGPCQGHSRSAPLPRAHSPAPRSPSTSFPVAHLGCMRVSAMRCYSTPAYSAGDDAGSAIARERKEARKRDHNR